MHFRKLSNKDWKAVEDRIEKRLSGWKGKFLSVGGRLVLINYVLSSLPMFMLSFFLRSQEESSKKLNTTGQDSFVRMTGIKRNIGWSNGTFSINQKNKED